MAEARSRDRWEHTSSMIYATVVAQNPKAAKRLSPADFNPWRRAGKARGNPLTVGQLLAMRGMFPEDGAQ
jgi:hypothetical protein